MNEEAKKENQGDKDFQKSRKAAANIGKRFYTWATLGTFAGACFLVSGIWAICKRLCDGTFTNEAWPLLFSVIVIVAFAFATEPTDPDEKTSTNEKIQKGLVTLGNVLLVYFSVVGANIVVSQVVGS